MRYKKYKRRFSRYRSRRSKGFRRGNRKYGFTSKIRRALFKISESKYADLDFGPFNLTTAAPATLIATPFSAGAFIPQGTGKDQRVGDSIFVTKMTFKFHVLPVVAQPNFNSLGPFFIRFIWYTNRAGGNAQSLNWGAGGMNVANSYTIVPRENIKVFKEKTFTTDAVANVLSNDPKNAFGMKIVRLRINKKLTSQGGNWNNTFWFGGVYCNDARDVNLGFQINGVVRVYYKDI